MTEPLWTGQAQALAVALHAELPHLRRRAEPGFSDLARQVVQVWGPQPGLSGEVTRLLRDMGRFATGAWTIYLENTPGGLTLARLIEELKATKVSGGGRARALIAYLRFIGFIELHPGPGDQRQRRYRTTVAMRAAFEARIRRELEVRTHLDPAVPALLVRFSTDPAAFTAYFVLLSEVSLALARLGAPVVNELDVFSDRYAGLIILCELLQRGDPEDRFLPRGPIDFNVADVARQCGTSRMQVTTLLRAARKAGHMVPTPCGRERFSEGLLVNTEGLIAGTSDMAVGCARVLMGGPPTIFD